MKYTRKDFIALAASAGAGSLLLGGLPARRIAAHEGMPAEITNALEHKTYDMFSEWFAWLRSAGVPGYLGEHSTPNGEKGWSGEEVNKWLGQFEFVYQLLDANQDAVPLVSAHSVALSTFGKDGFRIYVPISNGGTMADRTVGRAQEQASVLARHQSTPERMHGMNSSAGTMGAANFSAQKPGVYGVEYAYLGADDYSYLLSQGQNLTRLAFKWERVQKRDPTNPDANPPLRSIEIDRLTASCNAADSVGMKIILDVHNYAEYVFGAPLLGSRHVAEIGAAKLSISAYAQFWAELAGAFKDHVRLHCVDGSPEAAAHREIAVAIVPMSATNG